MSDKISIITPTFNSKDYIISTYQSIKNQTYTNWEWLVTDDCSTDGTVDVLYKIAKSDNRVKIFSNVINSGAAVSRNKSLDNVSGEYIAFIDSDDIWKDEKLYIQLQFMKSKSLDFSFTAYELIDAEGNAIGKTVDTHHSEPLSYNAMLCKKATLGCSTVMLRKKILESTRMPLLRTGQDYALWLKILKDHCCLAYPISEVLTSYRILPNSISRNKIKKCCRQWQIYRSIETLPLLKASYCFLFYAWRAVFRK